MCSGYHFAYVYKIYLFIAGRELASHRAFFDVYHLVAIHKHTIIDPVPTTFTPQL